MSRLYRFIKYQHMLKSGILVYEISGKFIGLRKDEHYEQSANRTID